MNMVKNSLIFGFFFQEFWKEMGEMGLLGITAPGETSGGFCPVNVFVDLLPDL